MAGYSSCFGFWIDGWNPFVLLAKLQEVYVRVYCLQKRPNLGGITIDFV